MRIRVVCDNRRCGDPAEPFAALRHGLIRIGAQVEFISPSAGPDDAAMARPADAVFLWNGRKGPCREIAQAARRRGSRVIVMERGFFDRMNFTQFDPHGFNHTASWARPETFAAPAPADGQARFVGAVGRAPAPLRPRAHGCLLVLLQVPGDSQLDDCELHHPLPLVQAVQDAAPAGLDIRVRAHPLSRWAFGCPGRARLIEGTLEDALASARFAVTLNSNSGNDALASGCPVLALGPALYTIARAARRCTLFELDQALRALAEGDLGLPCEDPAAATRNYLFHLACRQIGQAELAEGQFLARLLQPPPAAPPTPPSSEGTEHDPDRR